MSKITKAPRYQCLLARQNYLPMAKFPKLSLFLIKASLHQQWFLTRLLEECENVIDEIEGTTPSLVFDFSQPLPVPSNDDKKNLVFMQSIQEFGISHRAHEKILLERFSGIKADGYNICIRGCMQFNNKNDIACIKCSEARYKNGQTSESDTRVPVRSIIQLPLARQLALCLADDKTRAEMIYRHNYQSSQDGQKADVFDGHVYQFMKHLFSGENDIAILLSMDGFNPHNVPGSVTIVHATVLNLSLTIHYEKNRMIQIAMLPGCTGPSDIWSFLKPMLRDLSLLQTEGMEVKALTTTIRAKVHVLMATGDIPALAKLACHWAKLLNMASTSACCLEPRRAHWRVSETTIWQAVKTERGSMVWGLVRGKYGIKHPLCLSLATQREIGTAMVATKSTIPTSLHGAWSDVTKNASFFSTTAEKMVTCYHFGNITAIFYLIKNGSYDSV
ncbi:hypothetical protein PHYBLDRAFT_146955 [Phycomyces blakesleeanus NRRL 1555(-)]|uniref:Uncharacterized protein n=1 Tax=Phycomyces blakesleeanus (strain ATCC 8743b / DSM 1359 / FGSC 10004 / NBRC 33097 / NRRL 1555) TaxID=763407 RepID=A0A162U323_PHYB8|nr:hypothetical protein PHYBLDRAFT_146955 [Phycomyces blakesleeanus NRRL 1555(-)]OAD71973.1 hypothetical protein PHYBLDRAFT_146955 [Phycomyces blakesleeanus NRRL 1555(-)]|eukprot:XP_018290013.1 hypothetical protein PHYBLDRAFT_146955 [Phycomyces blakesleeanus NRRL 1555(-)]